MRWPTVLKIIPVVLAATAVMVAGVAPSKAGERIGPEPLADLLRDSAAGEAIPRTAVFQVDTVEGETLMLVDGGRVRLAAIHTPDEPSRPTAEARILSLVAGRDVGLYGVASVPDRHGRPVAHVAVLDASRQPAHWVQGELVKAGLAVVFPDLTDKEPVVTALLALEARARAERLGRWGDPANRILRAAEPETITPGMRLVEGRVLAIGESRHSLFVNFGDDYRHDFTVVVQRSDRDGFEQGLRGVRALQGRHIRVRGYVFSRGGPAIRAMHRQTIEVLE